MVLVTRVCGIRVRYEIDKSEASFEVTGAAAAEVRLFVPLTKIFIMKEQNLTSVWNDVVRITSVGFVRVIEKKTSNTSQMYALNIRTAAEHSNPLNFGGPVYTYSTHLTTCATTLLYEIVI